MCERAQDLWTGPVLKRIERQGQRPLGERCGLPACHLRQFRTPALWHVTEECERCVQVVGRHRSSATVADRLLRGKAQLAPHLRGGPQREEQSLQGLAGVRAQEDSGRGSFSSRTGRSRRRMSRSACCTARLRTNSRSPAKSFSSAMISTVAPKRAAAQNHTVPTGLPGEPPSGPAIPETASDTFAPLTRSAPSAISRTVCSLTAPKLSSVAGATPRSRTFAALE